MKFEVGTPVMDRDNDVFFVMQTKRIGYELKVECGDLALGGLRSTKWVTPNELSSPSAAAWRKWLGRNPLKDWQDIAPFFDDALAELHSLKNKAKTTTPSEREPFSTFLDKVADTSAEASPAELDFPKANERIMQLAFDSVFPTYVREETIALDRLFNQLRELPANDSFWYNDWMFTKPVFWQESSQGHNQGQFWRFVDTLPKRLVKHIKSLAQQSDNTQGPQ